MVTLNTRALEVADHIENAIVTTGWAVGTVLGDEATLMSEYRVGRSVFRQAVRLTEHLGVASMMRGRCGGLAVTRPGPAPAALSLRLGWFKQQLGPRDAERLEAAIGGWASSYDTGTEVIGDVVAEATELSSAQTIVLRHNPEAKQAQRVAEDILRRIVTAGRSGHDVLGSEDELMLRHTVGRTTLREAVQLLDLHGAAVMQRGPGGGLLVLRDPDPGALPRSLRAQLRSRGHDDTAIRELADELLGVLPSADILPAAHLLRMGLRELTSILAR